MSYRFPVSEQRIHEINDLLKENKSIPQMLKPNKIMASLKTLYKIGLGPSSSHTMGPNYAAIKFKLLFPDCDYEIVLYGSLAQTGKGHRTDWAIQQQLGPERTNVIFEYDKVLPGHTNGMYFTARRDGEVVGQRVYYSVGGGIVEEGELSDIEKAVSSDLGASQSNFSSVSSPLKIREDQFVYPMLDFRDHAEYCLRNKTGLVELVYSLENQYTLKKLGVECDPRFNASIPPIVAGITEQLIQTHLLNCWETMKSCIVDGLTKTHPIETSGALKYVRVASKRLTSAMKLKPGLQRSILELDAYALAVSEQNASASHLVVTTPTCGACGVLPGVLYYYWVNFPQELKSADNGRVADAIIIDALAVAGVIGNVCRTNASVSGAEAGCQAEVGVAQAMAAAAVSYLEMRLNNERSFNSFSLNEALANIEWAARDSLKNNLGLTCDPVNGLVVDPCIQRNGAAAQGAMASGIKSVTGDYDLSTSFDTIVTVMYITGLDMKAEYKETAQAGIARYYTKDALENRDIDYKGESFKNFVSDIEESGPQLH